MATSNTIPVVIPQPIAAQATSENINVIPNGATGTNRASFQEGFPAITRMPVIKNPLPTQVSGMPPKQQDFNGLFNVVSQHNFFAQNGGTYSFNQAVSDAIGGYPKNAVLWYFPENEDPCLVRSLINDNTNNFVEDPTLIDDEHWKKLSFGGGGGEIGDVMFAPLGIDESLNLRRYLNGQVLIQSQFVFFTNKVKSAIALYPNLATTEENWQAEKTNSKLGQCGKFVVDDTAGTIRLPAVVNAQGLIDLALIGGIKSESLPNHYHVQGASASVAADVTARYGKTNTSVTTSHYDSGVLGETTYGYNTSGVYGSSTYQDGAPVQQEAVQYPYCIQVATGVEETLPAIREYNINTPFFFGQSMYSDVAPDNASWLASNGQWNAKTVYPDYYNWLVEQMNAGVSGFVASTAAYTDYDFVINTADQTFRLPLIAGRILVAKKEATTEDSTWYNLYSDGWLEQGGLNARGVITLLKTYKNTDYTVNATSTNHTGVTGQDSDSGIIINNKTVSDFNAKIGSQYSGDSFVGWQTCGYAEVPTQSDFTEVSGLYYYVGDTVQDASLINAGAVLGQLANVNAASRGYLVDSYHNGTEWYRIYSDGWIEQGGEVGASGQTTVTFPKAFSNTNYTVVATSIGTNGEIYAQCIQRTSATQMTIYNHGGSAAFAKSWYACGY